MKKRILYGHNALKTLANGARHVAKVVGITYGPNGGKVAVAKLGKIVVTTDGAALVRESQFSDLRRLGVSLVRAASMKSEQQSGDGTSTAVLLTDALICGAARYYTHTWDPVTIVRDLRVALGLVKATIIENSIQSHEPHLKRVGYMASHGDQELTDALMQALLFSGENGTVLLTKGNGTGVEMETKTGLTLEEGWASHNFSAGVAERVMEGPLVAVVAQPLSTTEDVQSLMEEASQWPGRGLVVFAPGVYGAALTMLTLNNEKGVLPSLAVVHKHNPKDLRDWLEDIACVTNATVVDKVGGFNVRKFESPWLGYARKVSVTKGQTVIESYMDESISVRVDERVKYLLAKADDSQYDYDKDTLRQTAAAIDGGVSVVRVGGYTEAEAVERRSRAEDALHAMQGCLRHGVVPGAGWALFVARRGLGDTDGAKILAKAMEVPLRTLAIRAGCEPDVIVSQGADRGPWEGWDPVTKTWRDFATDPLIVDPLDVVLGSLETAVSVACQVLLTGAVIYHS